MFRANRIACAAALFLAGAGCRSERRDAGAAEVRLAIAAQNSLTLLPVYLAHYLRHFEQEGLTVTLQEFPGSSKGLEALLGGSADVVAGYYDQTIQMAAEGRAIRAFVTMGNSPLIALAVSPAGSRRIARIGDLKAAKVGVTTLGSSTHLFLNYLLVRHGMAPDDVHPISIGTTSRAVVAMERGAVDAGVVSGYTIRHLQKRFGKIAILADTRTAESLQQTYGSDIYPSGVLYSTSRWMQQNAAAAQRLARAIRRTLRWIRQNPPEQIIERIPEATRGDDRDLYRDAIREAIPMFSADGMMQREGAEAVLRALSLSMEKVRTAHIGLSTTYTNEFVTPSLN